MKREVLVLLVIISSCYASALDYSENFQSYEEGYNTLAPVWIPQYKERVNISSEQGSKFLVIDSLSPFEDDRDIHVILNKSFELNNATSIYINWSYKVASCNSSWKYVKGISPEGSNLYLFYAGPENFFSIELKIFANDTDCGDGLSQILVFTRENSTSTSLIPYTPFNFNMSQTYVPEINLTKLNSTHFIINISLNKFQYYYGVIPIIVNTGQLLLESAGTLTNYYNFYITSESNSSIIKEEENEKIDSSQKTYQVKSDNSRKLITNKNTAKISNNTNTNNSAMININAENLSSENNNTSNISYTKTSQPPLSLTGAIIGILTDKYSLPVYIIAVIFVWGWLIAKVMEKKSWKVD